jgi:hypothetical protein
MKYSVRRYGLGLSSALLSLVAAVALVLPWSASAAQVAAGPAATPGERPGASSTPAGPDAPGTSLNDEELLVAMRFDYVALTGERGRARKTLGELNAVRYDERLAALPPGPGADEARARLISAWHARFEAVGVSQLVDPRNACRFQERTLRESMAGAPGSKAAGRLDMARADARRCLGRLDRSLERARLTGRALDVVLAEARALLASDAPAAPEPPGGQLPGPEAPPVEPERLQASSGEAGP